MTQPPDEGPLLMLVYAVLIAWGAWAWIVSRYHRRRAAELKRRMNNSAALWRHLNQLRKDWEITQ